MDYITGLFPNKRNARVYIMILKIVNKYSKTIRYFFTNKTITRSNFVFFLIK